MIVVVDAADGEDQKWAPRSLVVASRRSRTFIASISVDSPRIQANQNRLGGARPLYSGVLEPSKVQQRSQPPSRQRATAASEWSGERASGRLVPVLRGVNTIVPNHVSRINAAVACHQVVGGQGTRVLMALKWSKHEAEVDSHFDVDRLILSFV